MGGKQLKGMDEVIIYRFQLKKIQDALRVVANSYDLRNQDTCLSRMIVSAEKYTENALNNEKNKPVNYNELKKTNKIGE